MAPPPIPCLSEAPGPTESPSPGCLVLPTDVGDQADLMSQVSCREGLISSLNMSQRWSRKGGAL